MPSGMTAGSDVSSPDSVEPDDPPAARPVELAVARAHLRLGSLALARAELETFAGLGTLDTPGHVDLAEVRWRTGDLTGAGEAATTALGAGAADPLALAVAAEAAAALGRPNEARRLANKAMERIAGPIDDLFAGMPRSGVWPADPAEPPPTAGTMFHHELTNSRSRRAGDAESGLAAARAPVPDERPDSIAPAPLTLGFWDGDGSSEAAGNKLPDPAGELDAGRTALAAGSLDEATLRFALVLRLAPALAPAILEATDGVPGPAVNIVRGDAYRLVGLESEARRAYAAAAWSGARDRRGQADAADGTVAQSDHALTRRMGTGQVAEPWTEREDETGREVRAAAELDGAAPEA